MCKPSPSCSLDRSSRGHCKHWQRSPLELQAGRSRHFQQVEAAKQVRNGAYTILVFVTLLFLVAIVSTAKGFQADSQVVAKVNDSIITQQELDAEVLNQTLPLEQKLYAIRKAALENLITFRILEQEASNRGVTVAELRKQLAAGEVRVTSAQVEEAYLANASFFGSMSPDEAKERLRLDLETQQKMARYRSALAHLRQATRITRFLSEPRLPVAGIETGPSLGARDAPVTIVEFVDFECSYCRAAVPTLREVLSKYPTKVRVVFKHLPLQVHGLGFDAARAAFCAGQQNRFWEYHDALFAREKISTASFKEIAGMLGLKLPEFSECLAAESSRQAVLKNLKEADRLGIKSTPSFLVNGRLIQGAITRHEFERIIDRELETAASLQVQPPPSARKD